MLQLSHSSRQFLRLALSPTTAGIGAILSTLALVLAVRQGQLLEIAAYAFGVSVAAIAAVCVGGGTTLVYTSGSRQERSSVRRVRILIVVPVVISLVVVAAVLSEPLFSLPAVAVLMGGLTGVLNNLSEIESSYLRSQLLTPALTGVEIFSRTATLIMIGGGADYAWAMLGGAAVRQVVLYWLGRNDPTRLPLFKNRQVGFRAAYDRNLFGSSVAYAFLDRAPYLVVPLMVSPETAGLFAAIYMLCQSTTVLLLSGLHTVLAARSNGRLTKTAGNSFEYCVLALSLSLPAGLLWQGAAVSSILNRPFSTEFQEILLVSAMTVPAVLTVRLVQYRLMANRARKTVLLSTASSSGFLLCLTIIHRLADASLSSFVLLVAFSELVGLMIAIWASQVDVKGSKS